MILETIVLVLVAVGLQLLLGAVACAGLSWLLPRAGTGSARRRRWALWARAGQAMRRAIAWAALLLGAGLALHVAGMGLGGRRFGGVPWLVACGLLTLGVVSTTGCYLVLHAGWREARGWMRAARREARLGGFLLPAGVTGLLAQTLVVVLVGVPPLRTGTALAALVALASSGFVGLLCGLSGKPRPSGGFAALLYLAGLIAFVASTRPV